MSIELVRLGAVQVVRNLRSRARLPKTIATQISHGGPGALLLFSILWLFVTLGDPTEPKGLVKPSCFRNFLGR